MKYLLTLSLSVLFLLGCLVSVQPAEASGYSSCYSYPSHTYSYAPSYSYYSAHYWNGRYYPAGNYAQVNGYYVYQGAASAPAAPAPTYTTPPAYTDNWKNEVTRFLQKREDHAAYLQTLAAAGYKAPPGANAFGPATFDVGGLLNLGYAGGVAAGNTQYGYSVAFGSPYSLNSSSQAYGTTDMNILYQQSNRLADRLISGAADTTRGHQELVALTADGAARVAEFNAKARAIEALGRAANIAPSVKTSSTTTGVSTGTVTTTGSNPPPMPSAENDTTGVSPAFIAAFLKSSGAQTCISCHTGKTALGGFEIASFPIMSDEQAEKVYERIYSTDPSRRMPQGPDKKPGIPLTAIQKKDFRLARQGSR